MLYPIAIEPPQTDKEAYGVIVPDIQGCHSSGETIDAAIASAFEAITGHLEILSEDGEVIPVASAVGELQKDPDYQGMVWAVVDVDITRYMGRAEKINVTLPGNLVRQIDDWVKAHPGENRSAFLAKGALERLASLKA